MSSKLKTYSIGAMQYTDDLGAGWRADLDKTLKQLGIKHYNPAELESKKLKNVNIHTLPKKCIDRITGEEYTPKYWHDLARSEDPDHVARCQRIMSIIKKFDLGLVAQCDFVIAKYDKACHMGSGSRSELELAKSLGIPVYVVCEHHLSAWTMETVTKFFRTMDDLIEFLEEEYISGDE